MQRSEKESIRTILFAAILGLVAGVSYWVSPVTHSPDSRWVLPTAHSIVTEGDIGLNEYRSLIKRLGTYGLRKKNREYVNFFPVGPALVAAPFVAAIQRYPLTASRLLNRPLDGTGENLLRHRRVVEHLIASIIGAFTVALCFLTLTPLVSSGVAVLLTGAVAWGSSLWSVATRGLWQHGPAMLCLFGALAVIVRLGRVEPQRRWGWGIVLGVALASAYLMRPTTSIAIVALGGFVLIRHRHFVPSTIIGGLLVAVPFVAQNIARYDHILPPYYRGAELAFTAVASEAFMANLLSPSRGLLVLSSWVLVALISGRVHRHPLSGALWVWCVLHLLVVSMFDRWWGGHSFGPRFMSELVPPLAVLAALGFEAARRSGSLIRFIVPALIALSIAFHAPGALSYTTVIWNRYPRNIDIEPRRIWSVLRMQSAAPLYLRLERPQSSGAE